MKTSASAYALLGALLAAPALAAPAPQMPPMPIEEVCKNSEERAQLEYKDVEEEGYEGDAELVSGASCTASKSESCTISKAYTWTKSTSHTIGGSLGPSFKLSEVFTQALSIDASYTWTVSEGESTTTTITCPAGLSCGIAAKPQMVKITGKARKDPEEVLGGCDDQNWEDFEINSVKLKKTRDPENDTGEEGQDDADVNFFACLEDCEDEESCKKAKDEDLDLCPNTDKPEHWDD